jgi:MerR family transcriptional regulator, copper efflux regulator
MADTDLHQIGVVADTVGLSLRTIRHYEEVGLVVPSGRSHGGFRLYTDADIDLLVQVKAMKPFGFSLDEIGEVLSLRTAMSTGALTDTDAARLAAYCDRAQTQCTIQQYQLDDARNYLATLALGPELGHRHQPGSHPAK